VSAIDVVGLGLGLLGLLGSLAQVRVRKTVSGKGLGHRR
jgi:hypothetical protein